MENNKRHFIFGYGSLISSMSRAKTGETGKVWPARLMGYQRHWSVMTTEFGMSSVAVIPSKKDNDNLAVCNGLLIEINEKELQAFDIREQGYNRSLIMSDQLKAYEQALPKGNVWIYHTCDISEPTEECPITLSYLDVILSGCLEYGRDFTMEFLSMTKGWEYRLVNDRRLPRYPRYQKELKTSLFTEYLLSVSNLSKEELSITYDT